MNPSNHNFYNFQKTDYIEPKSIEEILNMLDIDLDAYYRSPEISNETDPYFVNNCFAVCLEAWEANMDIQPAFHEKKAVAHMCTYLSKSEDETSSSGIKLFNENKCSNYEQMKAVARAYSSNRGNILCKK